MKLRTRIAAVAGVAVAITVIAAAAVIYVVVRSDLRGEVEQALVDRARPILLTGRLGGPGGGPGGPGGPPPRRGGRGGPGGPDPGRIGRPRGERLGGAAGVVQVVSADGTPVRRTSVELPVSAGAREIARTGDGTRFDDAEVEDIHVRVLTTGLGGGGGALQVARPLTEVDSVLSRVLTALVLVGLAGIGLAALLGAAVARAALAPIGRFTARTESIAGRHALDERIEVENADDELGRLAHTFNATLDELEQAVESQRQLVADASHELRTPLASLRANVQTLERAGELPEHERAALRADIVSELDELTALVGDVMELARGARSERDLDDVRLEDVVRAAVQRAERRGGRFDVRLEPALVRGEPERIHRAVSNLLDNAVKYSPQGARIDVELRDGVLSVRDRGPGFTPADLPHVFERFYRSAESRGLPGSGLGLAIVRQAAEAHGGWVEAANAEGGGALLRVRFDPGPSSPGLTSP